MVDFAEAGATVPIINFGFILFKGVEKAIKKDGLIGIVYGGLASLSFVVSATVLVGMVVSLIVSPRKK